MPEFIEPISAFVLAGGKSSRMQQDKSLLPFRGRYLIEYGIEVLKQHTTDVRIIGDPFKYQFLKQPVVADRVVSNGPLSGIYTGLDISSSRFNLFLACDMPLMKPEFFTLLLERVGEADAAVFRSSGGKVEPLAAIYSQNGLQALKGNLALGHFKITDFLAQIRVSYLEEDVISGIGLSSNIFANVNSPEDLLSLEAIS